MIFEVVIDHFECIHDIKKFCWIPSILGDFRFSNWKISVFSSAKVICSVIFLFSSFVVLAFRGFNSVSCILEFICALVGVKVEEKVFAVI